MIACGSLQLDKSGRSIEDQPDLPTGNNNSEETNREINGNPAQVETSQRDVEVERLQSRGGCNRKAMVRLKEIASETGRQLNQEE